MPSIESKSAGAGWLEDACLTASVCHSVINLLSTVVSSAEVLRSLEPLANSGEDSPTETLETMTASAMEAARRLRRLIDRVKPSPIDRELINLKALLNEAIASVEGAARILCSPFPEANLSVRANRDQLRLALISLIKSAAAGAGPANPSVELSVSIDDRNHAVVAIRDHGPTLDESTRARAFEPFCAEMGDRGLTLVIAQVLLRLQNAGLNFRPAEVSGMITSVTLPLVNAESPPRA